MEYLYKGKTIYKKVLYLNLLVCHKVIYQCYIKRLVGLTICVLTNIKKTTLLVILRVPEQTESLRGKSLNRIHYGFV